MAIASTTSGAGTDWNNALREQVVNNFEFNQTQAPTLSADSLNLTFTFGQETVTFHSDAAMSLNPLSGTINGVTTPDTEISSLAVPLASFFAAIHDGDIDTLNKLLWSGADTIDGGASDDVIQGFAGSDLLRGNDGNDRLLGDAGSDKLYGGNGNDLLLGGSGNDQLFGDAGDDRLSGGAGNDRLTGGAGADHMVGGTGADTFIFKTLGDFGIGNAGASSFDMIGDFSSAEGDKIDIHAIDANSRISGNQDFTFIGTDPFALNTPGSVHVKATANPHVFMVELNTDNDVQAEVSFMVISPSGIAPGAGDFIL